MRGLDDFLGDYAVKRKITDHLTQTTTTFEGRATLSPRPGGARYAEQGHLILPSGRFHAERTYLWQASGARIAVLFDDGRGFHDFDPVLGGQAAEHLCGADLYRGGYDFAHWPDWSVTWQAAGPRKDYLSVTWYSRR